MKKGFYLSFIGLLISISGPISAAELTLFGSTLHDATRSSIRETIKRAGGILQRSEGDLDKFKKGSIPLEQVSTIEALYFRNKLVYVQYKVVSDISKQEEFRKILVSKYGQPSMDNNFFNKNFDFSDKYLRDGKYRWLFDNNMELVFNLPFSSILGSPTLTYVNRSELNLLEAAVKKMDDKKITEKTRKLGDYM